MDGAVVLAFNTVPSENEEADLVVAVAWTPNETFNGAFAVAPPPSEKTKEF